MSKLNTQARGETEETSLEKHVPIATPIQSIEAINKVVGVLFNYNRSVMYKDVAIASNLHPMVASQALSTARDIGLTELSGKRGLYVLTKRGIEYARLLTAGKQEEAKPILRQIIKNNPKWTEIMLFLKATRGQARDPLDLVLDIESKLGKKWSQSMRLRISDCLVSILNFAGLIQKEGGKIFSLVETEATSTEIVTPDTVESTEPVTISKEEEFEKLETNDFRFEIRRDLKVLDFAKNQFSAWVEYLKQKLSEVKIEGR